MYNRLYLTTQVPYFTSEPPRRFISKTNNLCFASSRALNIVYIIIHMFILICMYSSCLQLISDFIMFIYVWLATKLYMLYKHTLTHTCTYTCHTNTQTMYMSYRHTNHVHFVQTHKSCTCRTNTQIMYMSYT